MENLNAEQAINELKFKTKYAKFIESTGVLLSTKCAQFCLDHAQYYEQRIKELAAKITKWEEECDRRVAMWRRLNEENKKLTEENERLRGILLQFTDIVHKWGNKNGYDTSEISLVPVIYEANTIKSQIVADTVRKIKDRLINYESYDNGGGNYVVSVCDIRAVAKELEGEK